MQFQDGTPENNLYSFHSFTSRFPNYGWTEIRLPFYGEWFVSQGHSGQHTHRGEWQWAWDFVIVDQNTNQYKNSGHVVTDYLCYGQSVLAPAAGVISLVEDGVEDNIIGEVNVSRNWGNTVIIKHSEDLFTKLSHLKAGSITVKEGDNVRYGSILGKVGNSGRSPFPHLHLQIQTTPFIGSKTLKYPLFAFIENRKDIKTFDYPKQDSYVASIEAEQLLKKGLLFSPGSKLTWRLSSDNSQSFEEWEVLSTPYNKLYLYCKSNRSIAYFINDGVYFYFTHFEGERSSLLYSFYLAAFRLPLLVTKGGVTIDYLPANKVFSGWRLFMNDFIAPFYIFLKAKTEVKITRIGSEFDARGFEYESKITGNSFKKPVFSRTLKLSIKSDGIIILYDSTSQTEAICEPY